MKKERVIVRVEKGLHARVAHGLCILAHSCDSAVFIELHDKCADARSMLDLMMLHGSQGSAATILADGPDEEHAVALFARALAGDYASLMELADSVRSIAEPRMKR